jgi:hypothetical protein
MVPYFKWQSSLHLQPREPNILQNNFSENVMNSRNGKPEWKNHILQGTVPIFSGQAEIRKWMNEWMNEEWMNEEWMNE